MSLSAEESNFLRFYFLNLKIASKAVRAYFDSVHPPSGLASELANCSVTLKGLRFITNSQLKILYPSTASNVRSEDFDTTLMVCLLRNMTPHECAPRTGWDNLPLQGDVSTGADLARVKWYRNMLAHHEDGKLSPVDFIQYWKDLESAILRLGGPSLHQESQSAQHIALDTSLTDMLNTVRNCQKDILNLQMSHEKHTSMITDLQTTLHKQTLVKEKHETEIQLLQDSLQKGETMDQNLATKLSETTVSIAKSKEEIEACHKEIEMNEVRFKDLQEQLLNKQIQIDKLVTEVDKFEIKNEQHVIIFKEHGEQITKHDRKLAKQSEQLAEHDEQISLSVKDIDDIKKKQHNTDDSSSESRRKRLEDDTKALIEEDLREGTFVTTEAAKDGLLLLKQNGVLLITGYAGTGKSRISRHILHMFCTEYTSFKCIKLDKLQEWEDMVNRDDNVVVLLDDIFGETNCIYNREKDIPILDKVNAYVCKGNIKVMITIRDTVKRQCQVVFDSHRLFKLDFVDLSSDKYTLCFKEKLDILTIYMNTVRKCKKVDFRGFLDHSGITVLQQNEIINISKENPVKGFPLVVYQFVYNDKYFQLGSKFFDRPTEIILDEINEIRRKGEMHRKFMIQYGVMVYTAINENSIDPDDNSNVTEVLKLIDAIYGVTIKMKGCQISDAIKELTGSYLVKITNKRSYRYHHPTLQESVILSFAQIDDETVNQMIPLLSWTFFVKMVKSNAYKEKDGEVVLRIPANSYQALCYKLVDIYMTYEIRAHIFLPLLVKTEIIQQEDCVLLTCLLDAVEKKYHKCDFIRKFQRFNKRHADCITSYNSCLFIMKKKDVFLSFFLVYFASKENLYPQFQSTLRKINQIIKTDKDCFTTDCMKYTLIILSYLISKTEGGSVKSFKDLLDIIEENKIPVLLDQNINLQNINFKNIMRYPRSFTHDYYDIDTTWVYLSLCISNAYEQCNIPLLEYLLSRYHDTQFDVNLFLTEFYSKHLKEIIWYPLSNKPLKWMIEKFEDQQCIDIDFLLKIACKLNMFDTLEYLTPKCTSFKAISYLEVFLCSGIISKAMFNFLFSKTCITSTDLTFIVMQVECNLRIPDYIFDALLPHCLDNKEILTMACKKANLYVVKQIMETGQNVDIESALLACIESKSVLDGGEKHVKLIKYIIEKFGYEQLNLKDVCQQAYHFKKFKILEWCVKNTDLTLLNVDFIRNFALGEGGFDILEYTIGMTELSSFEKNKVLKSISRHYTYQCSSKILEMVSAVWDSTNDKDGLNMEEIVIGAYESKCFEFLMWIYENCISYISTDVKTLLMLACEDGSIDVANWLFQTFEPISLDIDGGKLFKSACDKMNFYCSEFEVVQRISIVNFALKHYQIEPFDLAIGLLILISLDVNEWDPIRIDDLVVSIFTKCYHCLSTQELEFVKKKSLYQKNYVLVNWMLENDNLSSFDKQKILDKACCDRSLKTIKLVSKYFSSLDMNKAMINACISYRDKSSVYDTSDSIVDCLEFLWQESDHAAFDINRIVRTVCWKEYVPSDVIRWILKTFQHNRISMNEVLKSCCALRHLYLVNQIFHVVENKYLHIKKAFCHACRKTSSPNSLTNVDVMLVDFLFQRLPDKTLGASVMRRTLLKDKSYDLILYFLKKGYYRNMDMKHLMNQACRHRHVRLVQWILANVQHTKLDVKSAFKEAADGACVSKDHLQCVALIRHYIQNINMLEIDTELNTINWASFKMTCTCC